MGTVRRSLKQQVPDVVKDYWSGELHSCYRLFEALQPIRVEHHGVDEGPVLEAPGRLSSSVFLGFVSRIFASIRIH